GRNVRGASCIWLDRYAAPYENSASLPHPTLAWFARKKTLFAARMHFQVRIPSQGLDGDHGHRRAPITERQPDLGPTIVAVGPGRGDDRLQFVRACATPERRT